MRDAPRRYDFAAAALAGGLALFEIVRLVLARGVTQGHTILSTVIGGVAFSGILALAAVALVGHRRVGRLFAILGAIAAAAHGIIVRAGGGRIGILYILASVVLFGLTLPRVRDLPAEA
jgi:hypothetical protein